MTMNHLRTIVHRPPLYLLLVLLAVIACLASPAAGDQTPPPWGYLQEIWTQTDLSVGFGLTSVTMTALVGSVEVPVHSINSGDWNEPTNWNDIFVAYTGTKLLYDLVADPLGATFIEVDLGTMEVSCPYSSFMSMGPTRRPVSIPVAEVQIPEVGKIGLEIGTYANYEVTVLNHIRLNQDAELLSLDVDGGTLELQDGYSLSVSRGPVNNTGTIWKSTGSGGFYFPREIINNGQITCSSGGLYLSYLVNNGTVESQPGGTVSIPGGPMGGTITAESGGVIVFRGTHPLNPLTGSGVFCASGYPDITVFDGIDVHDTNILVTGGNVLSAWGTWPNVNVTLLGDGRVGGARLWIAADHDLMLAGTGRLAMSNPGAAWLGATIEAQGLVASLVVGPQYTVEGSGFIFSPVINHGTITANRPDEALILECGAANSGTLRSESGGTLEILGRVEGGALVADATTFLYGAAIHTDTPLTGSGRFYVGGWSQTSTIEGAPIQNATVEVAAGSGLTAWGTWTNVTTRMTSAGPGGNYPWFSIPSDKDLILAGSGRMILSNPGNASPGSIVYTGGGTSRLVNGPLHTIEGSGFLNSAMLVNQGTVTANVPGEWLLIGQVANSGTLKSESGGTLMLTGLVEGGRIVSDSMILLSGATVRTDEPLTGSGIFLAGGYSVTSVLDGAPVRDTTVQVAAASGLTAWGTWTNVTTRMTSAGPGGNYPWFSIPSDKDLVLAGSGRMILSNPGNASPGSIVYTGGGTSRLVNDPSHAIEGSGYLYAALVNEGTVVANVPGKILYVGGAPTINRGLLAARNGGILSVLAAVDGSGRWQADGGMITIGAVAVTTRGSIDLRNGGILQLNHSSMTASDLTVDPTSRLGVASMLSLSGCLVFATTDETAWSWDPSAVLELTGGQGAPVGEWGRWAAIEVGGEDLGPGTSGMTANFHLESLLIADGAHVYLRDLLDNGNRVDHGHGSAEALYVRNLTLSTGAVLNTAGLHLYYTTRVGPGETIDAPVPEPATLVLVGLGCAALLGIRRSRARNGV